MLDEAVKIGISIQDEVVLGRGNADTIRTGSRREILRDEAAERPIIRVHDDRRFILNKIDPPVLHDLFCDDAPDHYTEAFVNPLLVLFSRNQDDTAEIGLAMYHPLSGTLARCLRRIFDFRTGNYESISDTKLN